MERHSRKVIPHALLGLTVVSGLVDAVSFLSRRVFTAKMTRNVVLHAFATAHIIRTVHRTLVNGALGQKVVSELGSNRSHIGVRFTGWFTSLNAFRRVSHSCYINGHGTKPVSWRKLTNRPLGKLGWLPQSKTVRIVQSID